MAKAKATIRDNAIIRYIQDTRAELQRTHWPTRQETIRLTEIVLAVTAAVGIFLWLMDVLFSWLLGGVVASDPLRIGIAVAALVVIIITAVVLGRKKE